jgi:hypothetical protein
MTYQTETATRAGLPLADDIVAGTGLEVAALHAENIGSLRGMSDAAVDVAECTCPEPCERDHANE